MGFLPRLLPSSAFLLVSSVGFYSSSSLIDAFAPKNPQTAATRPLLSSEKKNRIVRYSTTDDEGSINKAKVGLITFDLDDTLYPIEPVIEEANRAFAATLLRYGFEGIKPHDIDASCKEIRAEISEKDGPEAAAVLTHTEINTLAIQREMEKVIYQKKVAEAADEFQTTVDALSDTVVSNAKKWSKEATSPSVVEAVMIAWEMERHHAAERHLYIECQDVLEQIRKEHPDVMIGAVTDGKANPLNMMFTLAKYFDFCLSWEDDQGSRSKFFKDLSTVEGNAELKWIYNAALEKYIDLSSAKAGLSKTTTTTEQLPPLHPEKTDNPISVLQNNNEIWIHVGDDLAYDVGGSAQCGAKTILAELDEAKYKQTTRFRYLDETIFDAETDSMEVQQKKAMNQAAVPLVNKKVEFLTRLPEAINDIVEEFSCQPTLK